MRTARTAILDEERLFSCPLSLLTFWNNERKLCFVVLQLLASFHRHHRPEGEVMGARVRQRTDGGEELDRRNKEIEGGIVIFSEEVQLVGILPITKNVFEWSMLALHYFRAAFWN